MESAPRRCARLLAEGREYAKWLSIADDSATVVQAILAYRDRDRTG